MLLCRLHFYKTDECACAPNTRARNSVFYKLRFYKTDECASHGSDGSGGKVNTQTKKYAEIKKVELKFLSRFSKKNKD